MKTGSLVRIFRVLSLSLTAAVAAPAAAAPDLKAYRLSPTPAAAAQIAAFAKQHSSDLLGASANFALGISSYTLKNYTLAIQYLSAARPGLPQLDDYVLFYLGSARLESGDFGGAAKDLSGLSARLSPVAPRAAMAEAQAGMQLRNYLGAIKVLRENFDGLPHPDGDLLLAQAYEGQGELAPAAALYQRVFFTRPATRQALDASSAMERLKRTMGKDYPPPIPQQELARGDQWIAAKRYAIAKKEFQQLAARLTGEDREQAMVGIGAADVMGGGVPVGEKYLKGLRLARSEADAERYFYLEEAARLENASAGITEALRHLEKNYPESPWRLKALLAAGNSYLAAHQMDTAAPLFRAAAAAFPAGPVTAQAHWWAAWNAYLKRDKEAADLLKEQITKYPDDQRAASALYFLGRLTEEKGETGSARAYYEKLQTVFPHYYYGTLGSARLADTKIAASTPNAELAQSLDRLAFPARVDLTYGNMNPATRARVERARQLTGAGFPDWAETEVRYGAATDGQRPVLALALAKSDPTLAKSLRHMKVFTPEYLTLPFDHAPQEVWGYLFPLPLREQLTKIAKEKNLDPFLVAGLIRQESEFNPEVVSRAHAFGWMQILPSTGGMLARQEGVSPFQTSMLFDPVVSMKLGAAYLRAQLDRWNGSLEQTLAAYNAGPGRVVQWTAGTQFREPAEFIESIPFTETREYVQSVLRNAMVYRQLYASRTPPPQPANALTSTHADASPTAPASPKSGTGGKRTVARKRAG